MLSAETPEQALTVAADYQSEIDLAIVDAVLPNISGPELADRLVRLRREMRIMFCTGVEPFAACVAFWERVIGSRSPLLQRSLYLKYIES